MEKQIKSKLLTEYAKIDYKLKFEKLDILENTKLEAKKELIENILQEFFHGKPVIKYY